MSKRLREEDAFMRDVSSDSLLSKIQRTQYVTPEDWDQHHYSQTDSFGYDHEADLASLGSSVPLQAEECFLSSQPLLCSNLLPIDHNLEPTSLATLNERVQDRVPDSMNTGLLGEGRVSLSPVHVDAFLSSQPAMPADPDIFASCIGTGTSDRNEEHKLLEHAPEDILDDTENALLERAKKSHPGASAEIGLWLQDPLEKEVDVSTQEQIKDSKYFTKTKDRVGQ